MDETARQAAGERFRELHREGTFVLANVVEPATAKALAGIGVQALATSSSAHAQTIGRSDAAGDVTLDEHAEHTAIIAAATPLPVNVDAEKVYGHEPDDDARSILRLAETGAAGAGIEDWSGDPERGFYDTALAVARIEAAVEAAESLPYPFTITGRTECLMYEHPGGLDETLRRLQGFAAVGAHCLYAPFTWDLETVTTVVDEAGGPVNVLAPLGHAGLTLDQLAEADVRRVSIGGSLFSAQVGFAADRMAGLLETGRFD
jgi:2-methylisocitrate lyase-like PEP mutase family enzyme